MRIALIGTRGVPAHYGGFETAVEEVGRRRVARGHDVTVYCRRQPDETGRTPDTYLGMRLVHLPAMRRKALETLSHTGLSVLHLTRYGGVDAAIVFNAANAVFLPLLRIRRLPTATHVDGLEWRRAKWGPVGQRYYRLAEALSVRWSDALIADARGISDYYAEEFGADTAEIAYGAPLLERPGSDKLAELGLTPGAYHLVVARFEPENHVDVAIEGYVRSSARLPLVVVGSAPYPGAHQRRIDELATRLDEAEASPESAESAGARLAERAGAVYTWDAVAEAYETLCENLVIGRSQRGAHTGRRVKDSSWRGER